MPYIQRRCRQQSASLFAFAEEPFGPWTKRTESGSIVSKHTKAHSAFRFNIVRSTVTHHLNTSLQKIACLPALQGEKHSLEAQGNISAFYRCAGVIGEYCPRVQFNGAGNDPLQNAICAANTADLDLPIRSGTSRHTCFWHSGSNITTAVYRIQPTVSKESAH